MTTPESSHEIHVVHGKAAHRAAAFRAIWETRLGVTFRMAATSGGRSTSTDTVTVSYPAPVASATRDRARWSTLSRVRA
jgi:hypothetical protein